MLDVLCRVEMELPELLNDSESEAWHSVYIDYHPPFVARLWRPFEDEYRIYLHQIFPCQPGEALLHPHPWPSAMRVMYGVYEMGVGYGDSNNEPPLAATMILCEGAAYEMMNKNSWHYVRPLGSPAYSVMVTGKPWQRESPGTGKVFRELTNLEKSINLNIFRNYYQKRIISSEA